MKKEDKGLEKLFWLDLEMTGLLPLQDRILEAGAIITDLSFEAVDSYECIVFQTPECLSKMDEWCTKTHKKSGLTDKIPHGISESELDDALTNLATKHFGNERVVLCGNSIGQDRKFIDQYLPKFSAKLHYRMIDVSSFKEIFKHKFKTTFKKNDRHRAVEDIEESISEMKFYVSFISIP